VLSYSFDYSLPLFSYFGMRSPLHIIHLRNNFIDAPHTDSLKMEFCSRPVSVDISLAGIM
jgi:hypothetical protein